MLIFVLWVPIEHLPEIIGPASYVQSGHDKKVIEVPVCVRKEGGCVPQQYPPTGNSIVAETEAGQENPVSGDKLPFPIANPKDVVVMPLDQSQGTVEVTRVVPGRGHFMFLVHYFNPDNTPLNIGVLLQNDHYFE
ncbi:hypothetical protein TELCIR_12264, partial [Teladorsagia circumcincta]